MKIKDITGTAQQKIVNYIFSLPNDEVVSAPELTQKIPNCATTNINRMLKPLEKDGIFSLKIGQHRYFGSKAQIAVLRKHIENENKRY